MSRSGTIELPAELFARLLAAHRRKRTAESPDATGAHGNAHRALRAAAEAGHTRIAPRSAYLAAQHASRVDQTTEQWPVQEEADFYAICDLIPAAELARIHAEDEAERLATNAEYAAYQTRTQP